MSQIRITPETANAIAELQQLRTKRTERKPAKLDLVAEAINRLLNGELLLHEYKNKLVEDGPTLAAVSKQLVAYNMPYSEHRYTEEGFSFVVTCEGRPFRLVSAGEINKEAIADLVARYDVQMPDRPLTVVEAEESALFHHILSICHFEKEQHA